MRAVAGGRLQVRVAAMPELASAAITHYNINNAARARLSVLGSACFLKHATFMKERCCVHRRSFSHLDLLHPCRVVVLDNLDNSSEEAVKRVAELSGKAGENLSFFLVCCFRDFESILLFGLPTHSFGALFEWYAASSWRVPSKAARYSPRL